MNPMLFLLVVAFAFLCFIIHSYVKS